VILGDGGSATDQTQVFGADRCGDCRRAKTWLRRHNVPFVEFDTDADPDLRVRAVEIAGGRTNIPVIVAPDGTVLVEPTDVELATTLSSYRLRRGRTECR
jgi:mycoredoxin